MLTHENASERTKMEMSWQAPANYEGGIEFRSGLIFLFSKRKVTLLN